VEMFSVSGGPRWGSAFVQGMCCIATRVAMQPLSLMETSTSGSFTRWAVLACMLLFLDIPISPPLTHTCLQVPPPHPTTTPRPRPGQIPPPPLT
jgi:hypothetical protein